MNNTTEFLKNNFKSYHKNYKNKYKMTTIIQLN